MKLNNRHTNVDKSLQKIELKTLTNEKLMKLSKDIRGSWNCGVHEDLNIVIDALVNITEELYKRLEMQEEFKFRHIGSNMEYTAKLKDAIYEISWTEDGEKKSEIYKASKVKEYIQNGLWILEGRG